MWCLAPRRSRRSVRVALLIGAVGACSAGSALGQIRDTPSPRAANHPVPERNQAWADTSDTAAVRPTDAPDPSTIGQAGAREQSRGQSQPGPDNPLDPQDRIVPSLARRQQSLYDRLSATWNDRQVPAAFSHGMTTAHARNSGVAHVAMEAHNVDFYLGDGVGYHVRSLKAALVPKTPGEPIDFDDPDQYRIHVLSGEVLVRPRDLDALFNRYVLTYEPRALSSVENHTRRDTLEVTVGARLFKFIPPVGGLPTTLSGPIKVGKNNWLVYTPTNVTQFGMPIKPLLDAVGLSLASVTPLDRPGVKLEGDQLLMNPETLFPPPRLMVDRISKASLDEDGLTLVFASDTSDAGFIDPPHEADSYIWLQSGDARFFSTLLVNAHLQLLSDSDDPLQFHLYHYRAQSAAGTIRTDTDGTLVVRVPNDFEIDDRSPQQQAGLSRRKPDDDGG